MSNKRPGELGDDDPSVNLDNVAATAATLQQQQYKYDISTNNPSKRHRPDIIPKTTFFVLNNNNSSSTNNGGAVEFSSGESHQFDSLLPILLESEESPSSGDGDGDGNGCDDGTTAKPVANSFVLSLAEHSFLQEALTAAGDEETPTVHPIPTTTSMQIQPGRIASLAYSIGQGGYGTVYKIQWTPPYLVSADVNVPRPLPPAPAPIEAAFKTICLPQHHKTELHEPTLPLLPSQPQDNEGQELHASSMEESPENDNCHLKNIGNTNVNNDNVPMSPEESAKVLQSYKDALYRELRKLQTFKCYGPMRNDYHPYIIKHYSLIEDYSSLQFALPMIGIVMEYAKYGSLGHVLHNVYCYANNSTTTTATNGSNMNYDDSNNDLRTLDRIRRQWESSSTGTSQQQQQQQQQTEEQAIAEKDINFVVKSSIWIPITLSFAWLEQILLALVHIHSIDVNQHKDIKPSNVLLREDLTIALCDFGATSSLHSFNSNDKSNNEKRIYTEVFVAPERKCQLESGPNSDMYGFGVLALNLLTQEPVDKGMCNPNIMKSRYGKFYTSRIQQLEASTGTASERDRLTANLLKDLYKSIIEPSIQFKKEDRISSQEALMRMCQLKEEYAMITQEFPQSEKEMMHSLLKANEDDLNAVELNSIIYSW